MKKECSRSVYLLHPGSLENLSKIWVVKGEEILKLDDAS